MITPGIVVFDPVAFIAAFPAFATVPAPILTNNFNMAVLQLDNSLCSTVQDVGVRGMLLNLLTAHITALLNGVNGQPATGAVGRVSDASEGTTSGSLEYVANSESAAYYAQTPWGAQFWRSSLRFRNARYIKPFNPRFGPSWESWPE